MDELDKYPLRFMTETLVKIGLAILAFYIFLTVIGAMGSLCQYEDHWWCSEGTIDSQYP